MEYYLREKLKYDKNFKRYLDENSNYIKYLNRNSNSYKDFIKEMKIYYKERTVDKFNNALNAVEILSSIIETMN